MWFLKCWFRKLNLPGYAPSSPTGRGERLSESLANLRAIGAAVGQYRAELESAPFKRTEQTLRPLLDFLNADRTPGVILANDEDTSYLYTVYTNHDVFWNSTAAVSFSRS